MADDGAHVHVVEMSKSLFISQWGKLPVTAATELCNESNNKKKKYAKKGAASTLQTQCWLRI